MVAEWTTPDAIHSKCGEDVGQEAILAIDKNTETYWRHNAECYHWIIMDMKETKKITKIRLYQDVISSSYRFGLSYGLRVYVSDNPADFGDAVWEGILNAGGWQESEAFNKNGRYIKLVSKFPSPLQRMYEFDAYAEVVPTPTYTLRIESTPIPIPVTLNGSSIGNTPVSATVEEGTHTVETPREVST